MAQPSRTVLLQSQDIEQLFDFVDELRSHGVSRYVDIPQIVVCGDQSSGKSSVLEAVSGVGFPTKDNLCTRFATELILRRSPHDTVSVTVYSHDKTVDQQDERFQNFGEAGAALDRFPELYEEAKSFMNIDEKGKTFSEDILRVEISGPKQPHLTLVDLPGLFHASDKDVSDRDSETVKRLVLSYMRRSRTIILAVVSAKNDYALQIATRYAREIDPNGSRTLGIITKPDTIHPDSDSEQFWLNMAGNKNVEFRLGWHVLRNRDYPERDLSAERRDQIEFEFFSSSAWRALPPAHLGIATLKTRLSEVLRDQILTHVPDLVADVEVGLKECRKQLSDLGEPRANQQERRNYLNRASFAFSTLAKAAIEGVYSDTFFGDAMTDEGFSKRLRAVIQDELLQHAQHIRSHGRARNIVDDSAENVAADCVRRSDYVDEVREILRRTRGRELPGTFNPMIVSDLFYQQSKPWRSLVEACAEQLFLAVLTAVQLMLEFVTDGLTMEGISRHIVNPAMEQMKENLRLWVQEVMQPHERGHPITYNHYFSDTLQGLEAEEIEERLLDFFAESTLDVQINETFKLRTLRDALLKSSEADMDRLACLRAIDCMEAYYKVAQKTLVDNFSVLSVEKCLLQALPGIFCPSTVTSLHGDTVDLIATEPEQASAERQRLKTKRDVLERTLKSLRKLHRGRNTHVFEARQLKPDSESASELTSLIAAEMSSSREVSPDEEEAAEWSDQNGAAKEPDSMDVKEKNKKMKKNKKAVAAFNWED